MKTETQTSLIGRNMAVVEIGGDWFKLIHVVNGSGGATIRKVVLRKAEEADGLYGRDFLSAIGAPEVKGLPAIVCLPRQAVTVRLFDLPSGDLAEIADMIDLQIARQTPYSRDEIVFDYRLVDSDRQGYTRVMLVIAQAGMVRQRLRCVEDSGLSVERVTVTTDGWLSAIESEGAGVRMGYPEQIAYLDVDASNTDLLVAQRGLPLFSRSISVGLRDMAANREKAEEELLQEVVRAMETYRNENVSGNVERLVIIGPASRQAGLASRLQEGLGVTVTPAPDMTREALPSDPRLGEVSIAGVVGAAVSSRGLQIDLMPESMRLRKAVAEKARLLTLSAILVMVILAQGSIWVGSRYSRRHAYLEELNKMVEKTGQPAEEIESKRRKVELVTSRLESRMLPARLLAELHGVTTEQITYTSIEITGREQLVCRGYADTMGDVLRLVSALEASPQLVNAKSTRTTAGKEKTEFEVVAGIEEKRQ